VAAGLRAPDAATRLRAIKILRDAGYPEAAGPLAIALTDSDDRVKLEAIDAERALFVSELTTTRNKKKVALVVEVRTEEAGDEVVAEKLASLPHAVPAEVFSGLAKAMQSGNPQVRLQALRVFGVLARLGPADALPDGVSWTLEALKRGSKVEQTAAAGVLGRAFEGCQGSSATQASSGDLCRQSGTGLVDAVNSREPQVRRAAMIALGRLRYSNAVQALADQLSFYQHGPDAEAALEGLAGIGHATSAEIFRRTLTHPDAQMRRLAVEGLARAGSGADPSTLTRMGKAERARDVLLALHYAAIKLGGPVTPDELIAALKDSALRTQALRYLLELSPSLAPVLAESLRNPDNETRMLVADVLGFSHDPLVVPALSAAARDTDADVARASERAMTRIASGL
jgi:HEAT repeat protein